MNLGELKEAFYDYVDDAQQDEYGESQAKRFINTAWRTIARTVDMVDEGYFEKCANFTVSGNQIDQIFPLPSDFKRVKLGERLNGTEKPTTVHWVSFKDRHEHVSWPPHQLRDTLAPRCFLRGQNLGVVCPGEDFTLRLWYSNSPGKLQNDKDIPSQLPEDHHDTIALLAASIAVNMIDGKPFGAQRLLDEGMADLTKTLHTRNRQQPRGVRVVEDY